jgi:hypothetical protein
MAQNLRFDILDADSRQDGRDYGYYRIQVGSSIKYLSFHQPNPQIPDIYGERLGFDTVPGGDWVSSVLL